VTNGEAATDDECWFRVITNANWVNADGTISEQALKGNAFRVPNNDRPWSRELSGRLLSLVADLARDGAEFVEKTRKLQRKPSKHLVFAGVLCGTRKNLRGLVHHQMRTDVIHTPISPPDEWADHAHSDFVVFDCIHEVFLDEVRTFIQDQTKVVVRPKSVAALSALCAVSGPTPPVLERTASSSSTKSTVSIFDHPTTSASNSDVMAQGSYPRLGQTSQT
jgi:hypothetical protein